VEVWGLGGELHHIVLVLVVGSNYADSQTVLANYSFVFAADEILLRIRCLFFLPAPFLKNRGLAQ